MPLLKAYSHDTNTGERKFTTQLVPQVGLEVSTLTGEDLHQVEAAVAKALVQTKFPVELGFKVQEQSLKLIYTKKLLLETQAKLLALLDLLQAGILAVDDVFRQVTYREVSLLEHSYLKDVNASEPLVKGHGIYPGAVAGRLVFTIEELEKEPDPIWVLGQVTNQETKYFAKAKGVILTKSGVTSHAAILAKNLLLPTILGGVELLAEREVGKQVSIDANTGKIYSGSYPISTKSHANLIARFKELCVSRQKIKVLANAESPIDLSKGLEAGARGVGLCRSEHMFLSAERLGCIQDILFHEQPAPESYTKLLQLQEQDFLELFKLLPEKDIVIRYLDAPLHEFGGSKEENPMLGFRGARMLVAKPELIKIQTRATFSALKCLQPEHYPNLILEMPLVVSVKEVQIFKQVINETLKEFTGLPTPRFAVMLETPRACLLAGKLAAEVDYLSFGTNDLTQTTFAFSRDDASSFIANYKKLGIIESDPFIELDEIGVGELMALAISLAKEVNPKVHISVCGEQASNLTSLRILHKLAVDSISVSPGKVWPSIFQVAQL